MKFWDISRTLSNDIAHWPGDTPFQFQLTGKIAEGSAVNLGAIKTSVHNGTHADARFHFETDGEAIEKAPLEVYMGRAVVVDLGEVFGRSSEKHLITTEDRGRHLEELAETSRLLFKPGGGSDSAFFPIQIRVFSAVVRGCLRKIGVKLLEWNLP